MIRNTGNYIGYILAIGLEQCPILYFRNGHLIQQPDIKNEGWHPNKGPIHVLLNAGPDKEMNVIKSTVSESRIREVYNFCRIAYTDTFDTKVLLEFDLDEDENPVQYHKSRGPLILLGDEDFDKRYDESYACSRLESVQLTANKK